MKIQKIFLIIIFLFTGILYPQQTAKEILNKSFEAMGGREKLDNLHNIESEKIGYRHLLEQSERPEGPWITIYKQIHDIIDLNNGNVWKSSEMKFGQFPDWNKTITVISDSNVMVKRGEREFPGRYSQLEKEGEDLALDPLKILFTAEKSKDLKYEGEKKFNGIPHYVISFSLNDTKVKIYFSSFTYLISAIETVAAYPGDFFQNMWGDVNFTTRFSDYNLEEGGIRYPHQWSMDWNGYPYSESEITKLKLNADVPADSFKIPDNVIKQFEQMKSAPKFTSQTFKLGQGFNRQIEKRSTIGESVIIIPGIYTVTLIPQGDEVLIIEAPISNHYTKLVLEEVAKIFPGKKIKGVVSTGDAWTYMGGMREYVANEIPVYALNLNRPIINRLLNAPHTIIPDDLSKSNVKGNINYLNDKYKIGKGKNRVEVYPVRGSGGERMMVVYFPEYKVLYSSDLIQPAQNGGFFAPEYLYEVAECVKKNNLNVNKIYGMHIGLTEWRDVLNAIYK